MINLMGNNVLNVIQVRDRASYILVKVTNYIYILLTVALKEPQSLQLLGP